MRRDQQRDIQQNHFGEALSPVANQIYARGLMKIFLIIVSVFNTLAHFYLKEIIIL